MAWKTLDEMDIAGKRVLVRVDINVPVEAGTVTDTTRIARIRPTIDDILARGGKPMLIAHFDRPKGKVVPSMSLRVTIPALEAELGRSVHLIETLEGAEDLTEEARAADVLLLENIRFHPGEETNDPELAARLAALGDVYCNDAFSAAHRAHASTTGLARLMPCCAGRLMQAELQALEAALGAPTRPVMAVVGGAKVSTKLDLLGNLVAKVDTLVIGGGMANTFLAAMGLDVGRSLCEHEMGAAAREIMREAGAAGCTILLPADVVVARDFKEGAPSEVVGAHACPADAMILDAGAQAVARITGDRRGADADLERPAGRVRDRAVRCRDQCRRAPHRRAQPRRAARFGGRWRRYRVRAQPRGRDRGFLLRLHRRRGVPGVDGGQGPARRRGAQAVVRRALRAVSATTIACPAPLA